MHRYSILAGLVAGGGLLGAALLQVAVAAADTPSANGTDAFTIGSYTFDPFTVPPIGGPGGVPGAQDGLPPSGVETEGFDTVAPISSAPPLLTLGGGAIAGGYNPASQYFEVYSPSGTDLGSIDAGETVANLAGFTSTQLTIRDVFPATGATAAGLPATGSVYDVFNLGHGYANVYSAIPGAAGAKDTVTDTFVTPFGNMNLTPLFGNIDAAAALQPGAAFTGLADTAVAQDAFTLGGYTLDPFTVGASGNVEGFAPVAASAGVAPLLSLGGVSLSDPTQGGSLNTQSFTVYDGTAANATNVGSITTGEDVTNLLGMTNTQLVVVGASAAAGDTSAQAADLPAVGTVLDALNLGNGWENVYTATAGAKGTVTDTLITPFGNINLDSMFAGVNAANPLDAGAAFAGLQAGDSGIGADAFTIGATTFDPQTANAAGTGNVEGYSTVYQFTGAPPLLNIGGGAISFPGMSIPLAPQDFNVYSGSTDIASITANESVTSLLGTNNTEFTVTGVTPATGLTAAETAALPVNGAVYDVLNLGKGWENIYTAIPGTGSSGDTVTDTLVTPFGNINLDSLFGGIDAVAPLNPGDAFEHGLDAASAMASAADPWAFLGL